MPSFSVLLSATPLIVFVVLLIFKKMKLLQVSFVSLLLTSLVSIFFWKIKPVIFLASFEKGALVALDILFIIVGAVFFLEILKTTKVIENIGFYLESVSKDLRVQVILLAWFFENFLEGTAGFGTPGMIVAPLLIGLGITPIGAVIISLLGNSAAGIFGAAGTPIKIGYGVLAGSSLPTKAALINLVGMLVPVFILWFLVKCKNGNKKSFFEALPFALWSGAVFSVSSLLVVPLGQEFPTILGSTIGLALVLITTKFGIFVPKGDPTFVSKSGKSYNLPIRKVIFPYLMLIILLIGGKMVFGSSGVRVPIAVSHTFSFFNPGFALILVGFLVSILYKVPRNTFSESIKISFRKSIEPFLVIVFMSSMAQLMVNSYQNNSGLPSIIEFIAMGFRNSLLPLWSPLFGAFGSFLTGSVTVSNLMFGNFLATAAADLKFSTDTILALALVGGAAGNMIALADILVAEAVAGVKHKEREVIANVAIPCVVCLILFGLVGLISTS